MKPAHARGSNEVYLLGAGFSRAITPAMPLLQDLARHIGRTFAETKRIPPEVSAIMDSNLAHALSYLEQAKPWLTESDNLRHRALFLEFSSVIANDLDAIVRQLASRREAAAPSWLRDLIVHWHRSRSTVLTLNYDTLIETAALALPTSRGGPLSAQDLYPPLLTDAAVRLGNGNPARRKETFRLLKLHGSTNWYFSGRVAPQGEPIYFVPALRAGRRHHEEHELRLRAVADKYPFLVPPIYDKSALFTHETIRALWFEAGEAMKQASRVVCMGYSLPESDLTMKHFLRTTVSPEARVEIVDPAENALDNFRVLLEGAGVKLSQPDSGPQCIRDYVRRL